VEVTGPFPVVGHTVMIDGSCFETSESNVMKRIGNIIGRAHIIGTEGIVVCLISVFYCNLGYNICLAVNDSAGRISMGKIRPPEQVK